MRRNNNSTQDGLSSFVTFRLARTQNKLNAQATHILKTRSELSLVEWRIILLLRLHEGASMSKLAAEVQMDKGQLSRKVSTMVDKGLLFATPDEHDSRVNHLHLTRTAHNIAEQMTPVMQKRQAMLVDGVSADEMETFFRVLARIDMASELREVD